jgi:hypothetical protein
MKKLAGTCEATSPIAACALFESGQSAMETFLKNTRWSSLIVSN